MRIRLWTTLVVSGLATAGLLVTMCRVPAGEIIVPTTAQVAVAPESTVLPAIVSSDDSPMQVKAVEPEAKTNPSWNAPQSISPVTAKAIEKQPIPSTPKATPMSVPEFPAQELMYRVSVNSDTGLTGSVMPAEKAKTPEPPALVADQMVKTPTMLVHSRRIKLNFNISEVGPSGVSAVELWATRDGRAWQRYSNEPPPSGPLVVCVAEEGRYGFSIVVRNGVGVASPAPKTGDEPQMWVEVDETKPKVELTECRVGQGPEVCHLNVSWKASDINMIGKPITISTSKSKDGPWEPLAANIENTGTYSAEVPKTMPYEFFVRVEAADRAGHVGAAVTPEPMKVDYCRPRGAIIGIDAESKPMTKEVKVEEIRAKHEKACEGFMIGFTR